MIDDIEIRGARQHNLKNIDVTIPRNKLVVVTGMSGSGKSSLAFDTLYAEGQRRYVESLSSYARQFLDQMEKPDVDHITGLSPAISIEQKAGISNPRSIVATSTEIYDYLRLLYAHAGTPHCPKCKSVMEAQSAEIICNIIQEYEAGKKMLILSPLIDGKKGEHKDLIENTAKEGFVRLRVDGEVYAVEKVPALAKTKKHVIEAVVDRLKTGGISSSRLMDSVETALRHGNGQIIVLLEDKSLEGGWQEIRMSEDLACLDCKVSYPQLQPRNFSFNSPYGACKTCHGLGNTFVFDPDLIAPDKEVPALEAFPMLRRGPKRLTNYYQSLITSLAKHAGFDPKQALKDLKKADLDLLLYGTDGKAIPMKYRHAGRSVSANKVFEGVVGILERRFHDGESESMREKLKDLMVKTQCPVCEGRRLQSFSLAVKVDGLGVDEFTALSIEKADEFMETFKLSPMKEEIAKEVVKEIRSRLRFLKSVGLQYLSLDRESGSLSGGEAQRIRLATQLGSALVGVLYVLDEPSIGLHQRDNELLLKTLENLRELGNTVVVVEHDLETIERADYIVDLGPGAGRLGGELQYVGPPTGITAESSMTGAYIRGLREIEVPKERLKGNGNCLEIIGATENNLKNVRVKFPLGNFTCVTGVSGSGKSTLVNGILKKALNQHFNIGREKPGQFKEIKGLENVDKMIVIDQSAIGRTPRSNAATYTDAFTTIRDLYSKVPESRARAYKAGRFSFNVKGGRCEECKGDGIRKIEMNFLPDVYVECEVCAGKRYNAETLTVKYKGRSIAEVLDMTVEEAVGFFAAVPKLKRILGTLEEVGLGYIHLGQPATTLSGGEAQRVKLASELCRVPKGHTLYILDEPTTGLHIADIHKLLDVLLKLREAGNSVLVIEHNLDVIKVADHIIDMGPEGGDHGGQLMVAGTPEKVAKCKKSYTGHFLKELL